MKLFKILTILFLTGFILGGCAGMQLKKEIDSVPADHIRISIINDTDVVMCQNTVWLNHNVPGVYGPLPVCGGELQPGANQTFDRNVGSWDYEGMRTYGTHWSLCRCPVYGEELKEMEKRYDSRVISLIPEGTAIIKIYHDHYEAIPR